MRTSHEEKTGERQRKGHRNKTTGSTKENGNTTEVHHTSNQGEKIGIVNTLQYQSLSDEDNRFISQDLEYMTDTSVSYT
jgi:hypothetical protein